MKDLDPLWVEGGEFLAFGCKLSEFFQSTAC
jgi:hypothetical protein